VTTPLAFVLVGGYTAPEGRAPGLRCLRPRSGGGPLALDEVSTLDLPSPSYLVMHPRRPWLFTVSEGARSELASVALQPDGSLVLLSRVASGGDGGCHLALSPDGRHLVVAHYGSGTVARVGVGLDGRLVGPPVTHALSGTGPDRERQQGPHAHQVVWHGDELLVPDLGSDRVHRLRLGPDGALAPSAPPVVLPPGSGPRHLVVLPEHLVVACELSGELWLGRRDPEGGWHEVDRVPCSATTSGSPLAPSALRRDGDELLVANRGPGTVAVFTLDRGTDRLRRRPELGCGGTQPRDLVVDGDRLWVANQADDVVTVLDRLAPPPATAPLTVPSPTPSCVVLVPGAGQ
jgi:6-phosphogluconolactonase